MFRRNTQEPSKNRYLVAFAWLCVVTFLFSFISPSIQWVANAAARVLTGVQKIVYTRSIEDNFLCTAGVPAFVGLPYDSTWNQKSTLVFDKNSESAITEHTYAVIEAENLVVGRIERVGNVASLTPLFSSGNSIQSYTEDSTAITLTGKGSGTFTAEIPKQTVVVLGEPIHANFNGTLKKVGTVVAIHDTPQSPVKSITVRSQINPSALQNVCVVSL